MNRRYQNILNLLIIQYFEEKINAFVFIEGSGVIENVRKKIMLFPNSK